MAAQGESGFRAGTESRPYKNSFFTASEGRLLVGGIARNNQLKALSIGGVENHVHLLLSLPATLSVAKAVQLIKGGASKWIHDSYPNLQNFGWQEGYGAFGMSVSLIEDTSHYIEKQTEHHRRRTFQEEYIEFLRRHNIGYDDKYIWE